MEESYGNACLSGPECGLCFTRRGELPLAAFRWRSILGPVTGIERGSSADGAAVLPGTGSSRGYYRRSKPAGTCPTCRGSGNRGCRDYCYRCGGTGSVRPR